MLVQPLPEDLWLALEPLLPPSRQRRDHIVSDRRALEALIFILRTNMSHHALPPQFTCGSPATLWRRLRRWQDYGSWPAVEAVLRAQLPDGSRLAWERLHLASAPRLHPAPGTTVVAP